MAVVEVDGGRLGTREPGVGPGMQQPQPKEDKSAGLVSLQSATHAADPPPEPPPAFRDQGRVLRLVRDLQAQSVPPGLPTPAAPAPAPTSAATAAAEPPRAAPPKQRVRTCVASLCCSDDFGPLVAGEAQARGFYEARRPAFVGDGQQYNWTIQKGYFPHIEPITDFIHLIGYLYLAAWAVADEDASRWTQYERWLNACWAGRATAVSAELATWQERLGRPLPAAERQERRLLVAEALTYLENNATRMDYPRYRCQGLPVTSSGAESLVGEFVRVKGWDQHFLRGAGAEAIWPVRAAVLSDDQRWERYVAERPGNPFRRHRCAQ